MTTGKPKRRGSSVYHAYRCTSPGHPTKIVFAAGIWSAVGVLLQWRALNGVSEDVPLTVDPSWAGNLDGVARDHIEAACGRCRRPGIGARYRADMGWGTELPRDERE